MLVHSFLRVRLRMCLHRDKGVSLLRIFLLHEDAPYLHCLLTCQRASRLRVPGQLLEGVQPRFLQGVRLQRISTTRVFFRETLTCSDEDADWRGSSADIRTRLEGCSRSCGREGKNLYSHTALEEPRLGEEFSLYQSANVSIRDQICI